MNEIKEWSQHFPKMIHLYSNIRLQKPQRSSKKFDSRLKITFKVTGDLQGTIDCYFSLDKVDIAFKDAQHLFGIISESMNILTGQFLSSIQEGKVNVQLSTPALKFQHEYLEKHMSDETYNLIHEENKILCLIRPQLHWMN